MPLTVRVLAHQGMDDGNSDCDAVCIETRRIDVVPGRTTERRAGPVRLDRCPMRRFRHWGLVARSGA